MKKKFIPSILIVLFLSIFFYLYSVHTFFSYLSYPFLKLYARVEGISYTSKQALYNDLHSLRQEKNKLLSENIALSAQLAFIKDTKSVEQFSRRYEDRVVATAQVLAHHLSDHEQFLLLDGGRESGIEKDMIVIYYNQLIGVVTHVFPLYAKVRLITDDTCFIGAYCSQTGEHGVAQGVHTNQLTLSHINHTKEVLVGDTVYSSGKGGVFPRGFVVGTIIQVKEGHLYYDITLQPLFAFADIEYCSILRV